MKAAVLRKLLSTYSAPELDAMEVVPVLDNDPDGVAAVTINDICIMDGKLEVHLDVAMDGDEEDEEGGE